MPKQTDGLVDRVRREREGRDPVLDISLRSMNEHVLTRKVDRAQRHLVRIFIRTYNTASNARDGFKSTRTCTPLRQRAPLFRRKARAFRSLVARASVVPGSLFSSHYSARSSFYLIAFHFHLSKNVTRSQAKYYFPSFPRHSSVAKEGI